MVGDLLALSRVDLGQVHASVDERTVVLAQGFGERCGTRGVGGVGVEATEQGRQRGARRLLHLGRVGADLLGELVEVDLGQDLVHCGHGYPSLRWSTAVAATVNVPRGRPTVLS